MEKAGIKLFKIEELIRILEKKDLDTGTLYHIESLIEKIYLRNCDPPNFGKLQQEWFIQAQRAGMELEST